MTRHQHHRYVLALAAVFWLTESAFGQTATTAKTTEVTLFGGISAPASNEGEGDSSELRFQTGVPFGGRIGYNLTSHHEVEFTVANPLSFYANYLYNFRPVGGRWIPYVTAGAGGSRYGVELGDSSGAFNANSNIDGPGRHHTAFTGNFGGGVKYRWSKRLALRLDVRDLGGRHKLSFGNVPGVPGGILGESQTLHDTQFTAGIVFRLGGR